MLRAMILYPDVIWEADMARAYGFDLWRRVVDAIDGDQLVSAMVRSGLA